MATAEQSSFDWLARGMFATLKIIHLARVALCFAGVPYLGYRQFLSVFGESAVWLPVITSSVPLAVVVVRSFGLISDFWERTALFGATHGGILVQGLVMIYASNHSGHSDDDNFFVIATPCLTISIFTSLRRSLEVAGYLNPVKRKLRMLPFLIINLAAFVRMQGTHRVVAWNGLVLAVLMGLSHFMLEMLIEDLESTKKAVQQQRDLFMNLLDMATDGFCSVSTARDSPELVELSSKLQATLHAADPSALHVSDVFSGSSDANRFQEVVRKFQAHASRGRKALTTSSSADLATCLLTCVAPATREEPAEEFEVRLFPFQAGGQLQVCFQVASERRAVIADPEDEDKFSVRSDMLAPRRDADIDNLSAEESSPGSLAYSLNSTVFGGVDDRPWHKQRRTRRGSSLKIWREVGIQTEEACSTCSPSQCRRCGKPPGLPPLPGRVLSASPPAKDRRRGKSPLAGHASETTQRRRLSRSPSHDTVLGTAEVRQGGPSEAQAAPITAAQENFPLDFRVGRGRSKTEELRPESGATKLPNRRRAVSEVQIGSTANLSELYPL